MPLTMPLDRAAVDEPKSAAASKGRWARWENAKSETKAKMLSEYTAEWNTEAGLQAKSTADNAASWLSMYKLLVSLQMAPAGCTPRVVDSQVAMNDTQQQELLVCYATCDHTWTRGLTP
jgi:hypothetical protein